MAIAARGALDAASVSVNPLPTLRTRVAKFAAACLLCLTLGAGAFFAVRAHERRRAEIVLRDLRLLDGAVDRWTIELGKTSSELPTWKDCKGG